MEKVVQQKEVYDPWNLLGKEFNSEHCKRKKSRVIMYYHTGDVLAKCECGNEYWYDRRDDRRELGGLQK